MIIVDVATPMSSWKLPVAEVFPILKRFIHRRSILFETCSLWLDHVGGMLTTESVFEHSICDFFDC
jgi:hypothetical protein